MNFSSLLSQTRSVIAVLTTIRETFEVQNMKLNKIIGTLVLLASVAMVPAVGSAHSYDPDDSAHPFRLISYPLHAIGKQLEKGTRKIHYCVSQPYNRSIYGHVSHPKTDIYWAGPNEYQRLSY